MFSNHSTIASSSSKLSGLACGIFLAVMSFFCINLHTLAGYVYPGRPDCPFSGSGHTWPEYLSGKFASGVFVGKQPFFSIKFKKDVGTISGGQCYTIAYFGESKWKASGYNNVQKKSMTEDEFRIADPNLYELSVWGAVFTFNEAGEVRLKQNDDLVGQMFCHIGSDCDK